MKTVTYITEDIIMKFLYNPKKTSLEGFVKEGVNYSAIELPSSSQKETTND